MAESWKKLYLFFYNLSMFLGFAYALAVMSGSFLANPDVFPTECWSTVGSFFKVMHVLMYLEVVNPLFGLTKGSVPTAMIQVSGRNLFLWVLIGNEERMQTQPFVFYLFMTYSSIEVFRYPYYILSIYDKSQAVLTWLRYSLWIPLYPVGFICEGVIAYKSIVYLEESQRFTILLPNNWNIAFHLPNIIRFYLLFGFFPMLYNQMCHMYNLRCKKLGNGGQESLKKVE